MPATALSNRSCPGLRSVPPFGPRWVPEGYTGPVALPGTGRVVWWTGRIAIGLRYAAPNDQRAMMNG
jgi:hypothetical protein